jgi:hypothetical protein
VVETVAGRAYARAFKTIRREEQQQRLLDAVNASGGRLLFASGADRRPVYLGIEAPGGERIGVMAYPFLSKKAGFTNRPSDEDRVILRYESRPTWDGPGRQIGRDLAAVDTTVVLGVYGDLDLFVGLDPALYDPLPLGISVGYKRGEVKKAMASPHGWHVFERGNIAGVVRTEPRSSDQLETVVMFRGNRLLDYVRLERLAADLRLDPALRYTAAVDAAEPREVPAKAVASLHDLEVQFEMSSQEILEMISQRNRLATAVRGGVAEVHLNKRLTSEPGVRTVTPLDKDAMHDFDVVMDNGAEVSVECKNASKTRYANGDMKVEVQKTRATQGDPAGRLYRIDQFDVVAACLWGPLKRWEFRYQLATRLDESDKHPGRLAPLQHVTDDWAPTLQEAL